MSPWRPLAPGRTGILQVCYELVTGGVSGCALCAEKRSQERQGSTALYCVMCGVLCAERNDKILMSVRAVAQLIDGQCGLEV